MTSQQEQIDELKAQVQRLLREVFPSEFRPPRPRRAEPGDDLLAPSPEIGEAFLKKRFRLLTRRCWPTGAEIHEARERYLANLGKSLPERYRDPEQPDIVRCGKTGDDITKEVEAEFEVLRVRDERKRQRELELQAQENAQQLGLSDPYALYEHYGLERPAGGLDAPSAAKVSWEKVRTYIEPNRKREQGWAS